MRFAFEFAADYSNMEKNTQSHVALAINFIELPQNFIYIYVSYCKLRCICSGHQKQWLLDSFQFEFTFVLVNFMNFSWQTYFNFIDDMSLLNLNLAPLTYFEAEVIVVLSIPFSVLLSYYFMKALDYEDYKYFILGMREDDHGDESIHRLPSIQVIDVSEQEAAMLAGADDEEAASFFN